MEPIPSLHAQPALPILPHLRMCLALPKLLVAAMLTFMEMLNPVLQQLLAAVMLLQITALLVPIAVSLLRKQQQLPLLRLIVHALPTPMEPIPSAPSTHAQPALPILPHLL